MGKFVTQKFLLILLLIEDIANWVLFTLSKTCYIQANLSEKFNFREDEHCFPQISPWFDASQYAKSTIGTQAGAGWMISRRHNWSLRSFIDWLVATIILQTPDPFPKSFISRTGWNNQMYRTMNTKNLSILLLSTCSGQFSTKAKIFSVNLVQKSFSGSSAIINLLKGNLQTIKTHYGMTKISIRKLDCSL